MHADPDGKSSVPYLFFAIAHEIPDLYGGIDDILSMRSTGVWKAADGQIGIAYGFNLLYLMFRNDLVM